MLKYVVPVASKHINSVFVETGTYHGDGVETALALGFKKVISIEMCHGLFVLCRDKFAADDRVTIIYGDSAVVLFDAIKDINDDITFWLDGHAFPEEEIGHPELKVCPLLEELDQISKHPIKNHTIMIDDMSSLPTGGVYKNINFSKKDVEDAVMKINGQYRITYFDRGGTDVLIASCR